MDETEDPGRIDDERDEKEELPPGADTKGDEDDISGNVGRSEPYVDGAAGGKLSPGGDNPPPRTSSD